MLDTVTHWRIKPSTGQFATCRLFPSFRDTVTDHPLRALRFDSLAEARAAARSYLGSTVERVEQVGTSLVVTPELDS